MTLTSRLVSAPATNPTGVPTTVLLGSFQVGQEDDLHRLMRTARGGGPVAVQAVLGAVARSAEHVWPGVRRALVLPVPGHLPGGPTPLVSAAARIVAWGHGWQLDPMALTRTRPSPEAKFGGLRDPAWESLTLFVSERSPAWRDGTEVIVLVDDIVRSGASLLACAEALRRSGCDRPILAVAISRASENPAPA